MHTSENVSISSGIKTPVVGLALGGGIVRGFAHMGVIQALKEAKIPLNIVTGSSAGSVVGSLYCAGVSPINVLDHAYQLSWSKIARLRWPTKGFFSFDRMEKWLCNIIGDINFSDLDTPLGIVATDVETGDSILLNSGKLAPAVRASCSIPGFFDVVNINGRKLADGSLVNSLPVDAARKMGANYVIGVDLFSPITREHWGSFGYGFVALEIVFQRTGGGYQKADCLIEPDLAGATYFRFSQVQKLFDLGYSAGKRNIKNITGSLLQIENT